MAVAVETFYSIRKLVRRIRSISAGYDLFSFDVFDTLLVRRTHDPDSLKMAVAGYISRRAAALERRWSPGKVQRLRDKVEAMHRRRTGLRHADREACYPDFMADVLHIIFGSRSDADLLKDVTAYELDIEASFLVARKEWLGLLDELKAAGKTLVAVSDMYLPSSHLQILLDRAGFAGRLDAVFSSADTFEAKASGAAWPRIAERMQVVPERWLHIGDNPVSDGQRAADYGIRAFVLRDSREQFRYCLSREYARIAADRPYWRGRLAQQWMLPLEAENQPRSELYTLGYHYFGPLLSAYVHSCAERARALGLRRVYFLSREGELLRACWRTIVPTLYAGSADIPEDRYLHVSRMALAGPACAHLGLTPALARIVFLPATNRDFNDLCRVFGLDAEPLKPFLKKYGLTVDTPLSRWHKGWHRNHDMKLQRLLETDQAFQAEVRRQTRPANEALQAYLEQQGFFQEKAVGLVDIGWLGTIQRYLHAAIAHRSDAPVLQGFLFAHTSGYPFPYADDNRLEGFFYDHRRFDFAGSLVLYAKEVFEEVTRAAHQGLVGYALTQTGQPELRFRHVDDDCARNEQRQTEYFTPLQEGILDAARRYAPVMAVLDEPAAMWKPWLNAQTVNRMAFPKSREVALLTQIDHLDDFGERGRDIPQAARRIVRRLWSMPLWILRISPWVRPWYYIKHAVHWLRS